MSKTETLEALKNARAGILRLANTMPLEKRDEVFLGVWSTRDMLAHLIGWDYANIESVNEIRASTMPGVFAHYDEEWESFNAELVRKHKQQDWGAMIDALDVSHRALLQHLQNVSADDFERDFEIRSPGGRNITVQSHLQAEVDDETEHLGQLKEWLDRAAP